MLLDFLARFVALVPRPRASLIRYYGMFARNSRFRARVTPAGRGKWSTAANEAPTGTGNECEDVATPPTRLGIHRNKVNQRLERARDLYPERKLTRANRTRAAVAINALRCP